jgi:bifunctional non-homologous end joining protein LigD
MKTRVGRRTIALSNLDKPLWPDDGITKRDLVEYYDAIGSAMLPLVRGRLLTLERFPNGIGGTKFYSKDAPDYFPDWIERKTVPKKGGTVRHVVCNEKATLVYLANQACITIHAGLSRIDGIDNPDQMVFDLDPATEELSVLRRTAHLVRELLDELGLVSFLKTSGSKGVHIVVPLDRAIRFDEVRTFAHDAAWLLAERASDDVTIEARKVNRKGRLFLDWTRNAYGQHAVAPYTVRARPGAPVAVPLLWDELDESAFHPQRYSLRDAIARAAEGDPWEGWRRRARSLRGPRARLDRLLESRPATA